MMAMSGGHWEAISGLSDLIRSSNTSFGGPTYILKASPSQVYSGMSSKQVAIGYGEKGVLLVLLWRNTPSSSGCSILEGLLLLRDWENSHESRVGGERQIVRA